MQNCYNFDSVKFQILFNHTSKTFIIAGVTIPCCYCCVCPKFFYARKFVCQNTLVCHNTHIYLNVTT